MVRRAIDGNPDGNLGIKLPSVNEIETSEELINARPNSTILRGAMTIIVESRMFCS